MGVEPLTGLGRNETSDTAERVRRRRWNDSRAGGPLRFFHVV